MTTELETLDKRANSLANLIPWEKGCAPNNPEGRKPSHWQDWSRRSAYYSQKYTYEQIAAIAADRKRLLKDFSQFDAMILDHLANMHDKNREFAATERERFLDRLAPTPKKDDDAAAIAAAVASGAVQGLMNALADKLMTVPAGEPVTIDQSVKTE